MFQIILSGVPQWFILGSLFVNFAHNNTIATFSNSVDDLITELQKESEKVIHWFRSNEMEINPD